MAIYSLEEILDLIKRWEKGLLYFYRLLYRGLKNPRSKKIVQMLRKQQGTTVHFLEHIDLNDYKHAEFIKNIPDFHKDDIIPHFVITPEAKPEDIFERILNFEEKLKDYYGHLKDVAVFQKSKELFEMLIQFKLGQIKEIKSYMDSFDLVI